MHLYHPKAGEKTGIYAQSVPATRKHIGKATEMVKYMDEHEKEWADDYDMMAWGLAHAQLHNVAEPLRIFVVREVLTRKDQNEKNARFPSRMIFNPEILEAPKELTRIKQYEKPVRDKNGKRVIELRDQKHKVDNVHSPKEGCMSFPRRKPKNVKRMFEIKVQYQYPVSFLGFKFLRTKTEVVDGLKSQIFQHEVSHHEGKNIFYD